MTTTTGVGSGTDIFNTEGAFSGADEFQQAVNELNDQAMAQNFAAKKEAQQTSLENAIIGATVRPS